jgi:GDP-L-fucose synthase
MKPSDKIYIAGHRGLVGSALMRRLATPALDKGRQGEIGPVPPPSPSGRGAGGEGPGGRVNDAGPYTNLLTRTHADLDLTDQAAVEAFFAAEAPDYVFLAAARVGGIHANNTYPA